LRWTSGIDNSSTGAVKLAKKAFAAEYDAERQQGIPAARQKLARARGVARG
jgi:hypothetical protein